MLPKLEAYASMYGHYLTREYHEVLKDIPEEDMHKLPEEHFWEFVLDQYVQFSVNKKLRELYKK